MFGTKGWAFDSATGNSYDMINDEEDLEKLFTLLRGNILGKQETIRELREEIKRVKDDTYKDSELQKMQSRYNEMSEDYYRGFPVSAKESERVNEWIRKHDASEHSNPKGYHGCSGGGFIYEFYPTAIGTAGTCICGTCRRKALNHACKTGEYDREAYQWYMKEHNGEFEFQELG